LPRAKKFALGKEIFAKFFSLLRVFNLVLGKEASVPSVFSVPGVFYFALGKVFFDGSFFISLSAKSSLPRVFYLALGIETNSRQSLGFW
jgi:hypothetical protein